MVEYRLDDAGDFRIYFHEYPGQELPRGDGGKLNSDGELALMKQPRSLERAIAIASFFMTKHTRNPPEPASILRRPTEPVTPVLPKGEPR